jgi:hypothetical protein
MGVKGLLGSLVVMGPGNPYKGVQCISDIREFYSYTGFYLTPVGTIFPKRKLSKVLKTNVQNAFGNVC